MRKCIFRQHIMFPLPQVIYEYRSHYHNPPCSDLHPSLCLCLSASRSVWVTDSQQRLTGSAKQQSVRRSEGCHVAITETAGVVCRLDTASQAWKWLMFLIRHADQSCFKKVESAEQLQTHFLRLVVYCLIKLDRHPYLSLLYANILLGR